MKINNNIFISGLPRSGSTLLGMILNQHKNIFHLGESWHWGSNNINEYICSCGKIDCKILSEIYNKVIHDDDILLISKYIKALDKILENKNIDFSGIDFNKLLLGFEKLFKIYRKVINKDIIVDKSMNIFLVKRLINRENWKIILLLRDPRGILYSYKKSSIRNGTEYSLEKNIIKILNFIEEVKKNIQPQNIIVIKYEDLVNNTELSVDKICKFLGITFNKSMLNYRKDKGHIFMANRMRLGGNININEDLEWKIGLDKNELLTITNNKNIVDFYKSFGYNI